MCSEQYCHSDKHSDTPMSPTLIYNNFIILELSQTGFGLQPHIVCSTDTLVPVILGKARLTEGGSVPSDEHTAYPVENFT